LERATIFDPLGLLSPFVMKIKLLFQKVWLSEEKEKDKKKNDQLHRSAWVGRVVV